jgi:hypothetical protein
MKAQITVIAIAILATMLIATPTIFSNSSVNTAFAKTTHNYCFLGRTASTDFARCSDTLTECQKGQAAAVQEGFGGLEVRITKECFRSTSTDKTSSNWCFDFFPTGDGKQCAGSKKECESQREMMKASRNFARVGSECYKL